MKCHLHPGYLGVIQPVYLCPHCQNCYSSTPAATLLEDFDPRPGNDMPIDPFDTPAPIPPEDTES